MKKTMRICQVADRTNALIFLQLTNMGVAREGILRRMTMTHKVPRI